MWIQWTSKALKLRNHFNHIKHNNIPYRDVNAASIKRSFVLYLSTKCSRRQVNVYDVISICCGRMVSMSCIQLATKYPLEKKKQLLRKHTQNEYTFFNDNISIFRNLALNANVQKPTIISNYVLDTPYTAQIIALPSFC